MKLIKKLPNGQMEVEAETDKEKCYNPGDFFEFNYHDCKVVDKKGSWYLIQ